MHMYDYIIRFENYRVGNIRAVGKFDNMIYLYNLLIYVNFEDTLFYNPHVLGT